MCPFIPSVFVFKGSLWAIPWSMKSHDVSSSGEHRTRFHNPHKWKVHATSQPVNMGLQSVDLMKHENTMSFPDAVPAVKGKYDVHALCAARRRKHETLSCTFKYGCMLATHPSPIATPQKIHLLALLKNLNFGFFNA